MDLHQDYWSMHYWNLQESLNILVDVVLKVWCPNTIKWSGKIMELLAYVLVENHSAEFTAFNLVSAYTQSCKNKLKK